MSEATAGSVREASGPDGRDVRAWDLPTRLFKWLLVVLVVMAWATEKAGDAYLGWHVRNGYAILILLVFRVLWGFAGSSTARFAAWVTWPWTAIRYGLDVARGRKRLFLGHNPLGGWMILALMALLAAQGLTGLFTVDSNGLVGGPFSNMEFGDPTPIQKLMSRWHHWAFNVILAFAALHIVANAVYQFVKSEPLIGAMITGTKPREPYVDQREMIPAPALWPRACVCLVAAVVLVLGGVKLFGGTLP